MSAAPSLSIVVPTCGREGAVRRLLRALAQQQTDRRFEAIVVGDGIRAGHTGVGDPRAWPFPVTVLEQPPSGAAVARNSGALAARADLLLFLDDDVEPAPSAIEAHLRFHRQASSRIGIGGLAPVPVEQGFIGSALAGWWEKMADDLSDPRHRYTFRDLLTGHCSLPRDLFAALGGFDASLRCHEDFEFGCRALEAGIDIRFIADAAARHHDSSSLDKIVRRKWDEGVADVQLAARHPHLVPALPLGRPLAAGRRAAIVHRLATRSVPGHRLVPPALRAAMSAFERLRMRDKWRDALERLMDYWYWRGVVHAAGDVAPFRAGRADLGDRAAGALLDVDLRRGIEAAERQIDAARPRALRVTIGAELVGVVGDAAGAERLRGVHLRRLLLTEMEARFTAASARAGLVPDVLVPLAAARRAAEGSSAALSADCAA